MHGPAGGPPARGLQTLGGLRRRGTPRTSFRQLRPSCAQVPASMQGPRLMVVWIAGCLLVSTRWLSGLQLVLVGSGRALPLPCAIAAAKLCKNGEDRGWSGSQMGCVTQIHFARPKAQNWP